MAPYVKAAAGDGQQDQHTYRLLAVLVHDGSATEGVFRVFVLHKPSGKWYECNDTEIIERPAHTVQYCEAYMLLYERV